MNIEGIIWLTNVIDKLAVKHRVEIYEVEEVLENKPRFRFVEKATEKTKMFIWLWGKPKQEDI